MDGRTLLSSLEQLCRDIDAGRPLRRINLGRALAPALIGFSLAAGGCPSERSEAVGVYGAPPLPPPIAEICTDGIDNDNDGRADCADEECAEAEACAASNLYGAPPMSPPEAENCSDGFDNDNDGRVDCGDEDCATKGACVANPLYGATMPDGGSSE